MLCTNIQGLRNNFSELKYVIKNKNPSIIFLNETHITDDCDISDIRLGDYVFVNCSSHSKHTGGVCAFIHKSIKYDHVSMISEHLAWYLSFDIFIKKRPIHMAGIYLSASENKHLVLNSFENWYHSVPENKTVMLCGDFNIDMNTDSAYMRRFKNLCDDSGLKLCVNTPTRVTQNSSTLIDLRLSNIVTKNIMCTVSIDDKISDHALLEIKIIGKCEANKPKKRQLSVWRDYDRSKLCDTIESYMFSWHFVERASMNEKMNWLLSVLSLSTEQFKSKITIHNMDNFFDSELENMRVEKNRLYKLAQYATSNVNEKWHEYRMFKNEYKNKIQIKKYDTNQNKLERVQGDAKGTWKVLKSILCKDSSEITYIKNGDQVFDDDIEIVNKFNEYFVTSIVRLNGCIPPRTYVNDIITGEHLSFEFRNVSLAEIKSSIKELKDNTDEFFIKPTVLRDAIFVIGLQIANIINESFKSGIFPEALKQSTILPIQKKSGSVLINEYRPINMLPCIEKVIEKLAYKQFNDFIQSNNLIDQCQTGFRALHSCESAINDVLYDLRDAQNKSQFTIAVSLDLQRAFEVIEPNLLIETLRQYGVQPLSLQWFKSYLTNRSQMVKIGDIISEPLNNNLGVPQGSILGPLLFILYINCITTYIKHCTVKMFADDSFVYISDSNIDQAIQKLNEDLNRLFDKLCQIKLKLNVDKTKAMIITNKTIDRSNIDIFINGTRLEIEREIKYLGVIIDDQLKFDKNIEYVCKKVGKKTGVLSRLRNELNKNQKEYLYKSLIQPHFIYCASILFLSNTSSINRLQHLQIKCMRQILNVSRDTNVTCLFDSLKFMNVKQQIIFRTLLFIHRIVNGLAPTYLTDRIEYRNQIHNRNLRNANTLAVTDATKACSQNALFYRGIQLYNAIPKEIRQIDSIKLFEKQLKNYVMENY